MGFLTEAHSPLKCVCVAKTQRYFDLLQDKMSAAFSEPQFNFLPNEIFYPVDFRKNCMTEHLHKWNDINYVKIYL